MYADPTGEYTSYPYDHHNPTQSQQTYDSYPSIATRAAPVENAALETTLDEAPGPLQTALNDKAIDETEDIIPASRHRAQGSSLKGWWKSWRDKDN